MPKLDKKKAASVAKQEVQDFSAIPPGVYTLRLRTVHVDKDGVPLVGQESGDPYWNWEFEVVSPETKMDPDIGKEVKTANRRLYMTTSLGESSEWALKAAFDAFGYETTSDTEEFYGELVMAEVSRGPIKKGPKQGQLSNSIDKLRPYEEADDADAGEGWDDE
jgi:hypothetical protein